MKSRIMYVEHKGRSLVGAGRIGRVTFSHTGRTVYYGGRSLLRSKSGYKWNYFDVDTGEHYWVSGCKKSGEDSLYPAVVQIDEDVREEYWTTIRNCPERVREKAFRSEGKHTGRKPR